MEGKPKNCVCAWFTLWISKFIVHRTSEHSQNSFTKISKILDFECSQFHWELYCNFIWHLHFDLFGRSRSDHVAHKKTINTHKILDAIKYLLVLNNVGVLWQGIFLNNPVYVQCLEKIYYNQFWLEGLLENHGERIIL